MLSAIQLTIIDIIRVLRIGSRVLPEIQLSTSRLHDHPHTKSESTSRRSSRTSATSGTTRTSPTAVYWCACLHDYRLSSYLTQKLIDQVDSHGQEYNFPNLMQHPDLPLPQRDHRRPRPVACSRSHHQQVPGTGMTDVF